MLFYFILKTKEASVQQKYVLLLFEKNKNKMGNKLVDKLLI